jgi:Cytochrome c554 and c-prime
MSLRSRYKSVFCFVELTLLFFCTLSMQPQRADSIGMETKTEERLTSEGWWPTKPGMDATAFVGSAECSRCHAEETYPQASTPMQHAAIRATDPAFLKTLSPLTLSSNPFNYTLTPTSAGADYTITSGEQKLSRPLEWVMGSGELGQTFLYQIDDHWYESQVSSYTHAPKLDITPGHTGDSGASLTAAFGLALSTEDAQRCFGCHTTQSMTTQGFSPLHAVPGLGCEACHGPGREHVNKMNGVSIHSASPANASPATPHGILNPAKLSPVDSVDFCGACHRTWADVAFSKGMGSTLIRFQPYRLELSKCWGKNGDLRITCVACHDPHQPLNRDPVSYDKRCLQCHTKTTSAHPAANVAKTCPKATQQCVTCHMPKVEVANMHGDFTDHDIRIVRPGEAPLH